MELVWEGRQGILSVSKDVKGNRGEQLSGSLKPSATRGQDGDGLHRAEGCVYVSQGG